MEEHKTEIAADVMRIIKMRSPDCCDFVFDKIRSFVDDLQANPQMAPQGQPNVHLRLLCAAGQGFLCGYEAALNGRFHLPLGKPGGLSGGCFGAREYRQGHEGGLMS